MVVSGITTHLVSLSPSSRRSEGIFLSVNKKKVPIVMKIENILFSGVNNLLYLSKRESTSFVTAFVFFFYSVSAILVLEDNSCTSNIPVSYLINKDERDTKSQNNDL